MVVKSYCRLNLHTFDQAKRVLKQYHRLNAIKMRLNAMQKLLKNFSSLKYKSGTTFLQCCPQLRVDDPER